MATLSAHTEEPGEITLDQLLQTGIEAVRRGQRGSARRLLHRVTEIDPAREEAWLWLAGVAETSDEALAYLRTVLALNPNNRRAREGLRTIQQETKPTASGQTLASEPTRELSVGCVLSVEQAEAVDDVLFKMSEDSDARCIILADITGQLIAERGHALMNTQVLSALAAGELAATHELARLVGEKARFKLLLHEGEHQCVYLSDVGEQLILVIVFDNETPIGMVRLVLKRAVEQLTPILGHDHQSQCAAEASQALGGDFAQLLEDELDLSLASGSPKSPGNLKSRMGAGG